MKKISFVKRILAGNINKWLQYIHNMIIVFTFIDKHDAFRFYLIQKYFLAVHLKQHCVYSVECEHMESACGLLDALASWVYITASA